MTGKKITYYLLAAFIAGNLLLIYIQYNSAKNINTLIKGNEKVLAEIDVINNLRELKRDIISVEGKTGTTIYPKDAAHQEALEAKIMEMESDIDNLQKISDDDSSEKYIDVLDLLVHEKLYFSKNIPIQNHLPASHGPVAIPVSIRTKELNDSIRLVTRTIESSRQRILANVTASIDKSGKKALNLGTTLIVLVLLSGAVLFWTIVTTIRKQNQLIDQLNFSDKRVREMARVKENFMANMSHEIRTPMNAILGFTNLLERKNLDEESMIYVQTIQKSGESLLTIINDILDLSKIEAGMMRIESAPFSIRALLLSVETMFKVRAEEKNLHLSTFIDESLPDELEGDATRLTQILVNLIGNSLKFTSKGNISIKITNEGFTDNIVQTGITVSDTGIGIEKEKLRYIFERFRQAEDSVTRKYGGSGLGLSIVNDLVSLQHGSIEVKSEAGSGTSFRLIIPYTISSQQFSKLLSLGPVATIQPSFENVRVLVAEDNEVNQSLIKHLFKMWQLQFDMVNNGLEAINKLATKDYDLILMDIQMPEMDGYTATREIRAVLNSGIPIIAMTAHVMPGEREKCLSYGMNEYISKPLQEEKLVQLIVQFAEQKKPPIFQKASEASPTKRGYQYINLQYMKDVSGGNIEYERSVTGQFIETIPEDLVEIERAWQNNDINQLRHFAHNMKTTISVMGLNDILQPYLDSLEYEKLTEEDFRRNFLSVKLICDASLQDAKSFRATL